MSTTIHTQTISIITKQLDKKIKD